MDLPSPDCVYTVNRRSRFTSVLRVAFEDTRLTQLRLLPRIKVQPICTHPLLVHTCTYALLVLFKSTTHAAIYEVQKILSKSRYDLDLVSPLRIRIDLDSHSRVASPNMC